MSTNNFIPEVWSAKLQHEREKSLIAIGLCNREFEGEIKQCGDTVRINGVTRPTVHKYVKGTPIKIENLGGNQATLVITEQDYFSFEVDDIDARQAKGNIMNEQAKEAGYAMNDEADKHIYKQFIKTSEEITTGTGASAVTGTKVNSVVDGVEVITIEALTSSTIFSVLAGIKKKMHKNNVPTRETISLEASPDMLEKITLANIGIGNPNAEVIKEGMQGKIKQLGLEIMMTNNIFVDNLGYEYIYIRTKKAIGYAEQLAKTEAFRPEDGFSDALKGLHLYGAKVLRPKELIVLKVKYAAETTI